MTDRQASLFDFEGEPWEEDDRSEELVATIVFPDGPPKELDYAVPDALRDQVEPGRRVEAPLGRGDRRAVGYCIRLETRQFGQRRLKELARVVDARALLTPSMLRLTQWIADYYICPLAQVFQTVVPAGVRGQAGTREQTYLSLAPGALERIGELKRSAKQAEIVRALAAETEPISQNDLLKRLGCTAAAIGPLRKKGFLEVGRGRVNTGSAAHAALPRQRHLELNPAQKTAFDAIRDCLDARRHETILVHGVTGSGKTEVYIQAIEHAVSFGRQAIVLVPEISLTPQTVERFRSRFDRVAVLHSHLSDSERHWHWQQIAEGRVQVVVGARSAVFAPVPHLGLIVLDEEHEHSFKQEQAPRYHAREVAEARSRAENVPLVLGSATPSLESWHRARAGEYRLIEMPYRVLERPLPSVGTIDLRDELSGFRRGAISRKLGIAVQEALDDGGQVMLLLNRRGYSTHIQCPKCGEAVKCPHCEISLTHHRTRNIALCHYCDHEIPTPAVCPSCQSPEIRYLGCGTQKLEAEVAARFPGTSILRMDTDTMQGRDAHAKALEAFRSGKVRILLGTQMIAKGLDFPNVTLVGVINADTALHLPDFRAAERTFHLVTQVAGRTGRGDRGGRVLVQTLSPDHYAICAAVRHDYRAFAEHELPLRKMLGYPPFGSMVRLVFRGPHADSTLEIAKAVTDRILTELRAMEAKGRALGPAPAPFVKLHGNYRFQVQFQGPDGAKIREAVRRATAETKPAGDVQWIVDVDPLDML